MLEPPNTFKDQCQVPVTEPDVVSILIQYTIEFNYYPIDSIPIGSGTIPIKSDSFSTLFSEVFYAILRNNDRQCGAGEAEQHPNQFYNNVFKTFRENV